MMTGNDRSERSWSVPSQYEIQRLKLIIADGTPRYLDTVRNVLEFHDIVDLLGRAATFEETIQLAVNFDQTWLCWIWKCPRRWWQSRP